MGLFKRAHIRGMVHELTRQNVVTWPSKLAQDEAADAIADSMEEEEVPEVTDEGGLTPEQAAEVLDKIVEVAEQIEEKTSGAKDFGVNKEAANISYEEAASAAAFAVMEKAAEETAVETGPDVPGETAPTPDLGTTAEGEVDAATNPSAAVVGPQGTTDLDTKPGAVGVEQPQESMPGAVDTPPTGEVAKLSSLLRKLASLDEPQVKLAAMEGASLSGGAAQGPPPTPRKDLSDNLLIPGAVATSQGQTAQDVPAAANVGVTKAQPAGTPGVTAPTPNKPAQDALKQAAAILRSTEQGRSFLRKLSAEAAQEDMKEQMKKEEKKKEEEEKQAQISNALQVLAHHFQ